MSKATRKHITPGVLATALGVVAVLALMAAVAWLPGSAQAQSGPSNPFSPATPTGVMATADSATQVTVTWTAGTGGTTVTGYEVERKVGSGAYTGVNPAHAGTMTSYVDTSVEAGMTYMYRVRANGSGAQNSAWAESAEVTVTAPTDPNREPVATGSISDLSLRISMTHGPIDVTGEFDDPDGDNLTYSATSDNPNVADAVVPNGMLTVTAGSLRGTARITVTADDGNGGTASISFTVTVAEAYDLTADPVMDPMLPAPATPDPYAALRALPADAIFVVTDLGAYDAKFHLAVAGSEDDVTVTVTASEPAAGGITITDSDGLIGAGFVDEEETDLEGSLTVKATDQGSRAFEIEGVCVTAGAWAQILVEDKDLDLVAEGAIYCKAPEEPPPPDDTITASECYSVTGYMGDDENETVDQMRDDIEPHTRPAHATNPEMGQDTIQILEGSEDVQITVTSCEKGPVYIRFLDSDGDVFGTDIDECETCTGAAGADVVGLDSQQKLDLNLEKSLDAAMALKYDQYNVVTPGAGGDKYLEGKAAADGSALMYYQGTFRFMAPCDWEPFQIEVYEKNGKVLQQLQNGMKRELVSCVAPEMVEAQPISVTQGSRDRGEMIIEWEPIVDATEYTVAVINTTNAAMYTLDYFATFAADAARTTTASGLTSGTRYIFAVYAELTGGGYSPVEYVINTPEFSGP